MWTVDPAKIVTAEQKAAEAKAAQLAAYKAAFDALLDAVARERQYDSRLTVPLYTASANPQWAMEAKAYIAWRDAALSYMIGQLAAVEAGETAPPSIEEFIAGIAPIGWPEAS
ncbi:hypothetical protein J2046_003013 [Rhizobium petrolearium]|uniref:hypothetical protein n=1 Tax=Neorhizobium petrolearium TaxID=515361 RepID=UPI001AE39BCB|nr:hypothetical protein [Neorhizobium petrolearium]MBP1844746.1 hypothetical protein [Neorhizobium petrolearium]